MYHKQLKSLLLQQFPSLREWYGRVNITARDNEYPHVDQQIYFGLNNQAWKKIEEYQFQYGANFPDCDDYADMMLGLFKIEWGIAMKRGDVPLNTPPAFGVCDGYNKKGEMHDFNIIVADKVYISDYGRILPPDGYRPLQARF